VQLPAPRIVIDTAEVFGLLSDPGRLRLLVALRVGEQNVGQLAAVCGLSESATSHALRLLRAHRVVEVRRSGRMAFYRLADAHVLQLLDTALEHAEHTELIHPERIDARLDSASVQQ
jgi:DNA-binding transcriptional ArsR family regulator